MAVPQISIQNARIIDNFYIWEAIQGINNSRQYEDFRISDNYWIYLAFLSGGGGNVTFKGFIDASTNPNYPAADLGDQYEISVKGKIGGASGLPVEAGDLIEANVDTLAGDQAAVGANWIVTQFGLQQIFEITGNDLSFSVINDLNQNVGNDWNLTVINDLAGTVGNDFVFTITNNMGMSAGGDIGFTAVGSFVVSSTYFSIDNLGKVTINDGTEGNGKVFTSDAGGTGSWEDLGSIEWLLNGNTVGSEKFIGTIDNFNLPFRVNNVEKMKLLTGGQLRIGDAFGNLFVGLDAGGSIGAGTTNTGIGYLSLNIVDTGIANTALGCNTLMLLTAGTNNTAIGTNVLKVNTGSQNTGIGTSTLISNTTGTYNTGLGFSTLRDTTTGSFNTASGGECLEAVTTGNNNTAGGYACLFKTTTSGNNIGFGYEAGFNNTTGAGNLFLGFKAGFNQTTVSDQLFIDNQDRGSSGNDLIKSLIYGKFDAATANQILAFNAGTIKMPYLTLYANNAAAIGGGLVTGDLYMVADVVTGSNIIEIVV